MNLKFIDLEAKNIMGITCNTKLGHDTLSIFMVVIMIK